ncbi:hypothetical protein AaE_004571, partial [Aphanomyces astaci]
MAIQEETSPLLPLKHALPPVDDTADLEAIIRDEVPAMYRLAYPVVLTYVLELTPGLVSLVLVGQMAAEDTKRFVDAAALSVMYLNLTALSVGIGLATAMDTLCAQAYGAGNIRHIGLYLQTGAVVLSAAFVPIFLANFYCADILIFLNQPEDVAVLSGEFSRVLAFGPEHCAADAVQRHLVQYGEPRHWLCVGEPHELWVLGAAISRTLGNMSLPLSLVPYFYKKDRLAFWPGWQLHAAVQGVPEFVYFGLAGMLMMVFEWWSYEIIALLAGLLPNAIVAIGANAVLVNITATVYMFYLGIAVAGNIRVGNALGSNRPKRAKVAAAVATILAGGVSVMTGLCVFAFRYMYPRVFTQDSAMIALAAQVAVVVAGFQLVDGLNAAIQGALRGCGLQNYGAAINFVSYLLFGLPVGYLFEFSFAWGLPGL